MKKLSRAMAKSLKPKKPSSSLPYPLARSPLLHAPSAKSQQLPRTPRMAPPATASASASAPVSLLFLSLPLSPSSCRGLPAPHTHLPPRRLALAPARPGAALLSSLGDAQEEEEYDDEEEEELVVVGYVSGAHGVRGDVLVSPRTDFPQLRFATVPIPRSPSSRSPISELICNRALFFVRLFDHHDHATLTAGEEMAEGPCRWEAAGKGI